MAPHDAHLRATLRLAPQDDPAQEMLREALSDYRAALRIFRERGNLPEMPGAMNAVARLLRRLQWPTEEEINCHEVPYLERSNPHCAPCLQPGSRGRAGVCFPGGLLSAAVARGRRVESLRRRPAALVGFLLLPALRRPG